MAAWKILHDDRHHQEQDRQRDQHLDERHAAPAGCESDIVAERSVHVRTSAFGRVAQSICRRFASHAPITSAPGLHRHRFFIATTHSPLATRHYSPHLTKNVCGITLTTYGQISTAFMEHGVAGARIQQASCASSFRFT